MYKRERSKATVRERLDDLLRHEVAADVADRCFEGAQQFVADGTFRECSAWRFRASDEVVVEVDDCDIRSEAGEKSAGGEGRADKPGARVLGRAVVSLGDGMCRHRDARLGRR